MNIDVGKDEDTGLYIITIVDNNIRKVKKLKDKILKELGLEQIHSNITVELQVIAKRKTTLEPKRYIIHS